MERIFGARPFIKDEAPLIHNEDEKKAQKALEEKAKETKPEVAESSPDTSKEESKPKENNENKDGSTS